MSPTAEPATALSPGRALLGTVTPVLRRNRSITALTAGSGLIAVILAAIGISLAARAIDLFLGGNDAFRAALAAGIITVAGALLWTGSDLFCAVLAERIGIEVRSDLVSKLLSLPARFFVTRSAGELSDRIATDVDALVKGTTAHLKPLLQAAFVTIAMAIATFFINPIAGLVFLVGGVASIEAVRRNAPAFADVRIQVQREWNDTNGDIEELIDARTDIRQLAAAHIVRERWATRFRTIWQLNDRSLRPRAKAVGAGFGAVRLTEVVLVTSGALLIHADRLTIGKLLALLALWNKFSDAIAMLARQAPELATIAASASRINDLLAEKSEPQIVDEPAVMAVIDWTQPMSVEFKNLTFAYDEATSRHQRADGGGSAGEVDRSHATRARPVLDGVDLTIPAGHTVGVVGRTGSGKSTLVKLLNRSELPPPGTVLLNGIDVRSLPLNELRSHVYVLSQRVEVMRASLADNISLFDRSISHETMIDTIEQLGLTEWLGALPDGLDTLVGHPGVEFSIGERQLIAAARVLVRNPAVVIMDEATAHLDSLTEQRVHRALDVVMNRCTCIVIAHRLDTVATVDQIAVLDHGRLVEFGAPTDLLEDPSGWLASMIAASHDSSRVLVNDALSRSSVGCSGADAGAVGGLFDDNPADEYTADEEPADTTLSHDGTPDTAQTSQKAQMRSRGFGPLRTPLEACRRHKRYFIVGAGLYVLADMAPIGITLGWRIFTQALEPGRTADWESARFGVVIYGVMAFTSLGLVLLAANGWLRWVAQTTMTIRSNLTMPIFASSDADLGGRHVTSGDAIARLSATDEVILATNQYVEIASNLLMICAIGATTGSGWVIVALALPLASVALIGRALAGRISQTAIELSRSTGRWTGRVTEVCASIRTVKSFGAEPHVEAEIAELGVERQRLFRRARVWYSYVVGAAVPANLTVQSAVLIIAAARANRSSMSGDQRAVVVAVYMAFGFLISVTFSMSKASIGRRALVAGLARTATLLPERPFDLTAPPADGVLPPAPFVIRPPILANRSRLDRIVVDDVSVTFEDGALALAPTSFSVDRGEIVIVTGPVGCGKSTLLRVLAGLTPPSAGAVRWNGMPVSNMSEFARPPHVAYVAQVPRIVSGTVAENVLLGRAGSLDRALQIAQLEVDVRRWGGAEAIVGHRGLNLSGGQVQRLAAARAIATESELLVVDDLSSALDVHTEAALWKALRAEGMTIIAAAHSPIALSVADHVIDLTPVTLRSGPAVGLDVEPSAGLHPTDSTIEPDSGELGRSNVAISQ